MRLGSLSTSSIPLQRQINKIDGIKNSSDKLRMKLLFKDVRTPKFNNTGRGLKFPLVAKHRFSSKGRGVYKLDDEDSLEDFLKKREKDLEKFIFEEYKNYSREYRLHVSDLGCFYSCRKMRKRDAEIRWKFNNETCVWILEENELFNKPETWDLIVEDCIKAKNNIGLDICCFDVRVNKKGDWMIIESNSAPSLGEIGVEKYKEHLELWIGMK